MSIEHGIQVGPYKILDTAGAGGMGKVFKALDTRLDRTVAIKVLLDLSDKPEVAQRFEREARAIAALNHPNICTLYDVGRHGDTDYLVMEYIEGETLEARLDRGPLPVDEVIRFGMQIADALDKAHRLGIIHRDLKPGNIMLAAGGVKLLDFGLAKLRVMPDQPVVPTMSAMPTEDRELTLKGTILGTLQYMSPEQVEGREADARTDVFAFGVVLYEMITARKAFSGKSHISLMAAILERDPEPISSIRPISTRLDRIIEVCLAKDPEERWQTAREILRELKWAREEKHLEPTIQSTTVASARPSRSWFLVVAVLAASLLAALVPAAMYFLESAPERALRRFTIDVSPMQNAFNVAISPDGRRLVYAAQGPDNKTMVLWVRPMDSLAAQVLPGTENAGGPFWSPDSRFIGFNQDGKLKKIDLLGGLPQTLCDAANATASWGSEGLIILGGATGIQRVPESGGKLSNVTNVDKSKELGHFFPHFLPDQKHFLFTAQSADPAVRGIYVASIETGERVRLIDTLSLAVYSAGFLLYQRDGTLMAHPFDAKRRRLTEDSFPIVEQVSFNPANGRSSFTVSTNGVLTYTTGVASTLLRLTWYDRTGKSLGTVGSPDLYQQLRLSPDERQVAYPRRMPGVLNAGDIWLLELASGVASRFTVDPAVESDPVWSPDSKQIAYHSTRNGKRDLYVKTVGRSSEEVLLESDGDKMPEHWLDGGLVFRVGLAAGNSINVLSRSGTTKTTKLFEDQFTKDEVHLSSDGRWVAFNSNEAGRMEVYVAAFPDFTNRKQVSNAGGGVPYWRKDGRELFYLSPDGKLMSVDVNTSNGLQTGVPKVLFQTRINVNLQIDQYNPTADGQKFLMIEPVDASTDRATPITVVLDWTANLPN